MTAAPLRRSFKTRLAIAALVAVAAGWLVPASAALASSEPAAAAQVHDLDHIRWSRRLRVLVPRRALSTLRAGFTGDVARFDRRLVERFATENFLRVDWVEVDDWDALIPALLAGEGDVVGTALTVTAARQALVGFTVPVRTKREYLVMRRGDRVDGPADLAGRQVVVRERSSFWSALQDARRKAPDLEIDIVEEHTSPRSLLSSVSSGSIDMAAVDAGYFERNRDRWPDLRLADVLFEDDALAFAVPLGAPLLREALDRFLSQERLTRLSVARSRDDLQGIKERGVLRILTRNNAASYFVWRGEQKGFEFELLREFAKREGLHIEMIVPPSRAALIPMLLEGAGDVVAGSLPVPDRPAGEDIVYTRPFNYVSDVVVTRHDDYTVLEREDLAGRGVVVRQSSEYWSVLRTLQRSGIDLELRAAPEHLEAEELIAGVAENRYDLTVVPSHILELELGWRDDIRAAFTLRHPIAHGWAVRAGNPELRAALDAFIEKEYRGLFYNVVHERYFENAYHMRVHRERRVDGANGGEFSPYDGIIRRYAAQHGFDWPLIVAQMYQESRFDPRARSIAGASGLMQLLPRTARAFGVTDLEDPEEAVRAGIAYLAWLHGRFESDLDVKARMWFSLAAYNAGYGHIADARRLAERLGKDPNRWFGHVEEAMVLLSQRKYYKDATYGYARGGETAKYVREIRERYAAFVQTVSAR